MKNRVVVCCLVLFSLGSMAQGGKGQKADVQYVITSFFKGFHAQDSLQVRATVAENMVLQTIGKDDEGQAVVLTEDFGQFLRQLASIPETTTFEEKIKSYSIQIDGPLAHVWTDYEFWVDGKMSHCGVNSFQLIHDGIGWKIIYLIDTRRKSGCF